MLLGPGYGAVRFCLLFPEQDVRFHGQAVCLADGLGQESRLIITPRQQVATMKLHRNNEACVSDELGPGPAHPPGDRMGYLRGVAVFVTKHQPFAGGHLEGC